MAPRSDRVENLSTLGTALDIICKSNACRRLMRQGLRDLRGSVAGWCSNGSTILSLLHDKKHEFYFWFFVVVGFGNLFSNAILVRTVV